ncbi:MAG: aldehyde dehydrogenase [Prolixibacteraceae bacterium]|nr:aldehyde dehydrogenase [Prolixibacteraceae bacterium]
MIEKQIIEVHGRQKAFYQTHQTKDIAFRKNALRNLKKCISDNEPRIMKALWSDLHKSAFESYATEIGMVYDEIGFQLKKMKCWARPKRVSSPLTIMPSRSYIYKEPFGNTLIISPWNYPLFLLISPLIGAISAGNTAILKPSPYVPEFSALIEEIINATFDDEYIHVFNGNREVNQLLLKQRWDYIFFTGSPSLGKIVMKAASENLTPVTLELGGKSPCIVDEDANLKMAARRIVWGKFLNAGQTCITPDYILAHSGIKQQLLENLKREITRQFGANPELSPDFPRVVNEKAFGGLSELMKDGKIVTGGQTSKESLYIAPTIIDDVKPEHPIMQDEIFGPLLPVLEIHSLDEAIQFVNQREKPLALYYFSRNTKKVKRVLRETTSGGSCINDTILHVANKKLPFGGVGNSGMGKYHGRASFDTFSNTRSVLQSSTVIDIPLKYAPYKNKMGLLKKFLR